MPMMMPMPFGGGGRTALSPHLVARCYDGQLGYGYGGAGQRGERRPRRRGLVEQQLRRRARSRLGVAAARGHALRAGATDAVPGPGGRPGG